MTGLFIKDCRLIKQNRQSFMLFMLLALIIGLAQNGTFIMGYLPFCTAIFVTSLMAYDEMDNGFQFLMTLPVTRALYVKEKYFLCMGSAVASWLLAAVLYFISKVIHGSTADFFSDMQKLIVFLPVVIVFLAVMIPVQLEFGVEKSRIVWVCLAGGIFAAVYVTAEVVDPDSVGIIQMLDSLNEAVLLAAGMIFVVAAVVISWLISKKVMMKKEF